MNDNITHLNDNEFDSQVLKADTAVLVDFWAEWCGPCKAIAPVLDDIATEYQGRLRVVKINIDHNVSTASQYGIRSIPTLLLFNHGELVDKKVGALSKNLLREFIDTHLA